MSYTTDHIELIRIPNLIIIFFVFFSFEIYRVLVELAQLQDDEVGDGTTSVVILAAELLKVNIFLHIFRFANNENEN